MDRVIRLLDPSRKTLAILTLLVVAVSIVPLAAPWLIGLAFDRPDLRGRIALAILAAEILAFAVTYLKDFVAQSFSERLVSRLRSRLFRKLLRLPMSFHETRPVGTMASRVLDETKALETVLQEGIVAILIAPISLAGLLVVMLWMSPSLTLAALAPAPILLAALALFVFAMRRILGPSREAADRIAAQTHEDLAEARTIQLTGAAERRAREFEDKGQALLDLRLRTAKLTARYYPLAGLIMGAGTVLVLVVGGRLALSAGTLVAFLSYLAYFYVPLLHLTRANHLWQATKLAAARILEILDAPEMPSGTRPVPDGPLSIDIEGVRFGYGRPVLEGASLSVPAGACVGIVGKTGGGKSTLASLVARLRDPESGVVRVGGVDVRELRLDDLRAAVALVGQQDGFFRGTVADHVADPGILRKVGLDLAADTPVGEGGRQLSEGERQRLSLARALARNPRVLILDEATSGLDEETEAAVLDAAIPGRTVILISHRERPMERCDAVARLEEGRLTREPCRLSSARPSSS